MATKVCDYRSAFKKEKKRKEKKRKEKKRKEKKRLRFSAIITGASQGGSPEL
jgi:chemotaxis response regulator CheB